MGVFRFWEIKLISAQKPDFSKCWSTGFAPAIPSKSMEVIAIIHSSGICKSSVPFWVLLELRECGVSDEVAICNNNCLKAALSFG